MMAGEQWERQQVARKDCFPRGAEPSRGGARRVARVARQVRRGGGSA